MFELQEIILSRLVPKHTGLSSYIRLVKSQTTTESNFESENGGAKESFKMGLTASVKKR